MKAIMKRFLLLLTLVSVGLMLTAQNAWAQKKPWVKRTNNVLTFSYGAKPAGSDVDEVPLNVKQMVDIPWLLFSEKIHRIVFTPSFKQAKNIQSTNSWFLNMENLTSITGLENLVTDNVTDMNHMFCNCTKLTSLNLSRFNTKKVKDMNKMFAGCENLTSLDITNFDTNNVRDMEGMFAYCHKLKKISVTKFSWCTKQAIRDYMYEECNAELIIKRSPLRVTAIGKNLVITTGDVSYTMVRVEGGTFKMGATNEQGNDAEKDELPVHQVTMSSFYIGQTEVTEKLWRALMGDDDRYYRSSLDQPATNITWRDCQEFIKILNEVTGRTFRLPTEAEWEYAARGGKLSKGYKYAGSNNIEEVAWYESYYNEVGKKKPNELGLYDMSGNAAEWCQDTYESDYYSSSPQVNPQGPSTEVYTKVFRGNGDGYDKKKDPKLCRVSYRGHDTPVLSGGVGIRLVLQQ